MKKIIAFFKRLFGVKAEVIVIPEPTKKKRKPRNKRKPRTDGGEPYVSGSGRQHHNKK